MVLLWLVALFPWWRFAYHGLFLPTHFTGGIDEPLHGSFIVGGAIPMVALRLPWANMRYAYGILYPRSGFLTLGHGVAHTRQP